MGDIMYSKVRTFGLCLRTTFSIAKNETSSLTRIYVGPFTAQIKCPRDWQLRGVDATGGRTGQSFPLHILSDKILLFSNARHAGSRYVMLWVSSVSVQSRTSSRLAEIQTATHSFIWFLSQQPSSSRKILLVLGRNFIEVQTLSKRVWLWLETWDEKKKTSGSSYGFGGNWKQVTTGNKSNHYQVLPDTSITYPQNNKAAHRVALPPLSSFSLRTLPPMDQSPTVFLPASCLEVKPRVGLGLVNLSAAGAVEREATCSGGSGASAPHTGLFFLLTLAPRLLFQARPL